MSDHASDPGADPLASIGHRASARLLDWALLMCLWLVLGGLTSQRIDDDTIVFARWAIIVWTLFVLAYEVIPVTLRGQTLGKRVLGIEIVSLRDGGRLSWGASLARMVPVMLAVTLLGAFFPVVMVFIYFSAAFMSDSRGALDRVAGSVVIQARSGKGLGLR